MSDARKERDIARFLRDVARGNPGPVMDRREDRLRQQQRRKGHVLFNRVKRRWELTDLGRDAITRGPTP